MEALHCYGICRLNPFKGVLQVARTEDARALSADGVNWEIQVLAAQPEHDWRSPNINTPILRYFRFGNWSKAEGLQRVPVSPLLDLNTMLDAEARLVSLLPAALERLPFPLGERYESWLLDTAHRPFALIASTTERHFIGDIDTQPWAAAALRDHGFIAPSLMTRGIPAHDGHNPRRHASELEQLVKKTAGKPARQAWFFRTREGSCRIESDDVPVSERDFPMLPLREDWDDPADADLVRDYLDWCAPFVLSLPVLDAVARDRFERAAAKRATLVASLYRLYPSVENPELIRALRVEVELRQANAV